MADVILSGPVAARLKALAEQENTTIEALVGLIDDAPGNLSTTVRETLAGRDLRGERVIPEAVLHTAAHHIEPLTTQDRTRMLHIMTEYQDNQFDYGDVAIMTLAERLNIREIYTFDRRDFAVFRPIHYDYLELLP